MKGTAEEPLVLGTDALPVEVVTQELEVTVRQKRGNFSDPRKGWFQCDVLLDGKRKWLSLEDYEYVCESLDEAKSYIERHYNSYNRR